MNRIKMFVDSFKSKEDFLRHYRRNREVEQNYLDSYLKMKNINDESLGAAREHWDITLEDLGIIRGKCTCGEVNKENRLGHAAGCRYFADTVIS